MFVIEAVQNGEKVKLGDAENLKAARKMTDQFRVHYKGKGYKNIRYIRVKNLEK